MQLTLYYHPLASYCHKVLIALYEHGAQFERRIVDLGDERDRAELAAIWPFVRFPVIRDHERKRDVAESATIIEYLDHYQNGAGKLVPSGWEAALDARHWERFFDHYVQTPVQAIVQDRLTGRNGDTSRERTMLATAYRLIDQRMAGRQWIAGEFSMAECSAAPALFYAATLEAIPEGMSHLSAYFERLMARPSVQRVLAEARPYFPMYPFAEAIPARFLEG
ncbi:glutathione S-transferase family protein [Massilia endophytica]|uniref:glutathione S-transferase family protein n=1 Tax=Massilia endophytica TaxID=2899220 RepID=UPI001E617FF1|nr:glutathione S-transferase family protein [Massilia endophytica]UGQ48331.1 glutathione S-transferase family protein [Massilia endophytica]